MTDGGDDTDKTPFTLSDTPTTPKDTEGGITTNSTLDYNRQSEDFDRPPRIEDQPPTPEQGVSEDGFSSREDMVEQAPPPTRQPRKLSSETGQFIERPKTASSSARSRTTGKSSAKSTTSTSTTTTTTSKTRTTSSASTDNTSSLLRIDDDQSEKHVRTRTPLKSDRSSTKTISSTSSEPTPVIPVDEPPATQVTKGEYNTERVLRSKESFQPIINEAASYGHLDIVRGLIEVKDSFPLRTFRSVRFGLCF